MNGGVEITYSKAPLRADFPLPPVHGCKLWDKMGWTLNFIIVVDVDLGDMVMVQKFRGTYNIGLEYRLQEGGSI